MDAIEAHAVVDIEGKIFWISGAQISFQRIDRRAPNAPPNAREIIKKIILMQHFLRTCVQRCPKKCLTKGTGSENLRRAIDEYWERFEREGKERLIKE